MTPRISGRAVAALIVAVLALLWIGMGVNRSEAPLEPSSPSTLVQRTTYRACGHQTETHHRLASEATLDQLELSGWTPIVTDGERLIVHRYEDGLCPDDQRFRHLRLEGDTIAVYLGRPRPDAVLDRRIPINRAWLLPEDIDRLEAGIVVIGEAGVAAILEGLGD